MAKGIKTGGRKAGSRNKLTRDVQEFVDKVFRNIDPVDKLTVLLSSESEKVQAGILLRLLEYRYGKPKESIELSGSVTYRDVLMKVRAKRDGEPSA
jgi:hypothetical protein